LSRQRFVRSHDQGGFLGALDDAGHGIGFTGTGDSQQCLVPLPVCNTPNQFSYRMWLVTAWFEISGKFKAHRAMLSQRNIQASVKVKLRSIFPAYNLLLIMK